MDQDISIGKKRALKESGGDHPHFVQKHYLDEIKRAPGVVKFLANANLRGVDTADGVKTASDFSYAATSYAGDHFRLVGDAGGAC